MLNFKWRILLADLWRAAVLFASTPTGPENEGATFIKMGIPTRGRLFEEASVNALKGPFCPGAYLI